MPARRLTHSEVIARTELVVVTTSRESFRRLRDDLTRALRRRALTFSSPARKEKR